MNLWNNQIDIFYQSWKEVVGVDGRHNINDCYPTKPNPNSNPCVGLGNKNI